MKTSQLLQTVSRWHSRQDCIRTSVVCVVLLVVRALLVLMLALHFELMVRMFKRRWAVCVLHHIQKWRNRELCRMEEAMNPFQPDFKQIYMILLKCPWTRHWLCLLRLPSSGTLSLDRLWENDKELQVAACKWLRHNGHLSFCCGSFSAIPLMIGWSWYLQSSRSRGFGSQSCCSPPSPASSASLLHQDRRNHLENSLQMHKHHITFFNQLPRIWFFYILLHVC